jgi:hypothetical protein
MGQTAAPRWQYLGCVVIHNIEDRCAFVAGAAFDVLNFPDVSSWGETVPHLDVTDRRFGVIALGAGIAKRRWGLAGDLDLARRQQPPLAHGDGSLARTPLAQIGVGIL